MKGLTLLLALSTLAGSACSAASASKSQVFVGTITDTECGPDHARMLKMGGMGEDDRSCTLLCVEKGATFGFVDESRKAFYQLDDQEKPARFAGQRVKLTGRVEGDTIFVESVAPAPVTEVPDSSSPRH